MVHLIKLAVGCHSVRDLVQWHQGRYISHRGQKVHFIMTRYTPKRAEEILETGGSIYRVINKLICCRQPIVGFEEADTGQGKKCLILTDTEIIRTEARKKKPFQGWRYLKEQDTPRDAPAMNASNYSGDPLIEAELRELGLL